MHWCCAALLQERSPITCLSCQAVAAECNCGIGEQTVHAMRRRPCYWGGGGGNFGGAAGTPVLVHLQVAVHTRQKQRC